MLLFQQSIFLKCSSRANRLSRGRRPGLPVQTPHSVAVGCPLRSCREERRRCSDTSRPTTSGTSRSTSRSKWARRIGEIEEMCAPLQEAAKQPDAAGTTAFSETWSRMGDKLCALAEEDESTRPDDIGGRQIRAGRDLLPHLRAPAGARRARPARPLQAHAQRVRPRREARPRELRAGRDPLSRLASLGALRPRRRRRGPRADPRPAQRPRFDKRDEIPRRPAALARPARSLLARGRPAGNRRGVASSRPHRGL